MLIKHEVNPYGHCATICQHKNGILISYYSGPECSDMQRIHIEYWERGIKLAHRTLEEKTGNSVLIPVDRNNTCIIYSYFNDTDGKSKPKDPVDRWRYCINYKSMIEYIDGNIIIKNKYLLNLPIGYLVRCNPLKVNNTWFLPVYREYNCYGKILRSTNGWSWHHYGYIGNNVSNISGRFGRGCLIQPTIWYQNDKFHSLSRDVTPNRRAWYSTSPNCKDWTQPAPTQITNYNNSLVAIQCEEPLLIWNLGTRRQQLVIGGLDEDEATPYYKLNTIGDGSYPNYCFDNNDNLHIVFSGAGPIYHYILKLRSLQPRAYSSNITLADI